jgi:hypothetical protein
LLGGAGGAGDSEDTTNEITVPGANGGGVVLVRGRAVRGTGSITARGADAPNGDFNGGGGGGAGGSVSVTGSDSIACTLAFDASGGQGASVVGTPVGPGGGGGGGVALVFAPTPACRPLVVGGRAGLLAFDAGTGPTHGATDGQLGVIELGSPR